MVKGLYSVYVQHRYWVVKANTRDEALKRFLEKPIYVNGRKILKKDITSVRKSVSYEVK